MPRMIFPPTSDGLRLGLGGAALGNLFTAVTDVDAQALLSGALAGGCRTLDTAPHYGQGRSEHRFGQALQGGLELFRGKVGHASRQSRPGWATTSLYH